MAEESTEKQVGGCFLAAWSLGVTMPMYFVLSFGVLQRIDAANWMWILFWMYVPAHILGAIFGQIWHKIMK
jgi:hypothetical protein